VARNRKAEQIGTGRSWKLLFVACALTYATTAAYAASLGRARWLGRWAAAAYVTLSAVALLFLVLRGLAFPSATGASRAWYTEPGFVVGIPAIPWVLPALLGVVLLRRAGDVPLHSLSA